MAKKRSHFLVWERVTRVKITYNPCPLCIPTSEGSEQRGRRFRSRRSQSAQRVRQSRAGLSCAPRRDWLWCWWKWKRWEEQRAQATRASCLQQWGRSKWRQSAPSSNSWRLPSSKSEKRTHCKEIRTSPWQLAPLGSYGFVSGDKQREWECPLTRAWSQVDLRLVRSGVGLPTSIAHSALLWGKECRLFCGSYN